MWERSVREVACGEVDNAGRAGRVSGGALSTSPHRPDDGDGPRAQVEARAAVSGGVSTTVVSGGGWVSTRSGA